MANTSPELSGITSGDLLRANASDKLTLGIFVNNRSVTGVVPGGYAHVALSGKIAAGDTIIAVDGAPVTEETFMTHIKNTRDAVGTKVTVLVDRKGAVAEVVLIKQRAARVSQAEKTIKALTALSAATSAATCKALSSEIISLLVSVAEDEAAVCHKILSLQLKAQTHKCKGSTPALKPSPAPSSVDPAMQMEIENLKKDLSAMTQRAQKAEVTAESHARDLVEAKLAAAKAAAAPATDTHTNTNKHAREVDALKAEVEKLKGEITESLKGKTREEQLAMSAQQLSRELETAKAEALRVTLAKNIADKELSSTKMALEMAQATAQAALANGAGSSNGSNGSAIGHAAEQEAEKEKEKANKKLSMATKLAHSLAEKVKTLEAQLAANTPNNSSSTTAAAPSSTSSPQTTTPTPASESAPQDATQAASKKKKKAKK